MILVVKVEPSLLNLQFFLELRCVLKICTQAIGLSICQWVQLLFTLYLVSLEGGEVCFTLTWDFGKIPTSFGWLILYPRAHPIKKDKQSKLSYYIKDHKTILGTTIFEFKGKTAQYSKTTTKLQQYIFVNLCLCGV